jgi:DNA polymerase-3 subunit gamma/tau
MRDAESTLDQLISFCGNSIVEPDVLSMFGLAEHGAGEFEDLRLRDATSKKILLEVALLRAIEARNALPIDTVLKQLQQLRESGGGSGAGATGARAASPPPQASSSGRESAPSEPASSQSRLTSAATTQSAPAPEPARLVKTPAAPAAADLESLWSSLVDAAGRASPFIKSYLLEAHPVSFAKNVFTIGFDPEFADHISLIDNSKNHTLLQTKLAELGHHGAQFKFIKAEAPANRARPVAPAPAPAVPAAAPKAAPKATAADVLPPAKPKSEPVPFNQDEFKNDPLIQKALEVFKGRIVEVRA